MTPLDAFRVPLEGTMLVEASAGTGKTHTITSLVLRLVLEEGMSVKEILVVTFTEAATAELRDRIRRRLRAAAAALELGSLRAGPVDAELDAFVARAGAAAPTYAARARAALRELDLAAVTTIHSFCLRMLQEHAFESGARFDLTLRTDTQLLVDDVATDGWVREVVGLPPHLYALCSGANGFGLATAKRIAAAVARRPGDTRIVPSGGPRASATAIGSSIEASFAAARTAFRASPSGVRQALAKADLNRRSYSEAIVERAIEAAEAAFAGDAPAADLARTSLAKLTPPELARGTKKGGVTPRHPFFEALGDFLGKLDDAERDLVTGLRRGAVDHVRDALPRRKAALRAQGFEDLLFSLDAALRGRGGSALARKIAARFRAALVDEFQDTDPVQFRIFRKIFHGRSALFLVGDPKQSIYAFRGADVFSYTVAREDATGGEYTLSTNRRSDPSLVKAVNTIFEGCPDPFRMRGIAFRPVTAHAKADRIALPLGAAAFEILFLPREGDKATGKGWLEANLPRLVAVEIARFLRSGATITREGRVVSPVQPGDVAVLTRKNAQARRVQAELRALGIPTALASDESVFASEEAAEVELLLAAVLEPTSARAVRSALATAIAGVTANAIASLETDEAAWDRWSDLFRSLEAHWEDHGFFQAFRRLLRELGAEARLLALVDGERRMTNLLHLGELLHAVAVRDHLGKTGLLQWLRLTRARVRDDEEVRDVPEATELRLESDAHAVKILTVHKSKGLEFPVVYCPFLWGGRMPSAADAAVDFHDPSAGHALTIDVAPADGAPSLSCKAEEERAESQRLLYVALTRAKHRCVVVWGAVNQAESSPLAYTLHGDRYAELDDAGLMADLERLVRRGERTIRVSTLDRAAQAEPLSPRGPARGVGGELSARAFTRGRVDRGFRIGSFTGLAAGRAEVPEEVADDDAKDHDQIEEGPAPMPTSDAGDPVVLDGFPRGAKAGTTLHAILEVADFTGDGLRSVVAEKLPAFGYADAEWGDLLTRGLGQVLATPLDASGMKLASVPREKRADELAFVFPVASRGGEALVASRLAAALVAHGSGVARAYADRLRSLRFPPLRGFLKGFVDLVFEHDGRFYVVDYKSNHLGPTQGDYNYARLVEAMADHDYVLQYHLYVVAVHRWLSSRLRDYDYDRHVGGVRYLFLRGMTPAVSGSGVFADRPSRALVHALSEVLDG